MHTQRRRSSRAPFTGLALTLLLGLAGALPASAVTDPGTAPDTTTTAMDASATDITFTGNGYGHGRGMGQYGALGYAVDYGLNYRQILDHYYGGTVLGTVPNHDVRVDLSAVKDKVLVAIGRGARVNGVAVGGAGETAVRAEATATGVVIRTGPTCAGPWSAPLAGPYAVGTTIDTADQSTVANLIRVCEPDRERAYRGVLVVERNASTGKQFTINRLPVEQYLRGVVPRESPDGWGLAGGGKGLQALAAQSVAARSYALASGIGALICDTTSCQVYKGAGERLPGGVVTSIEGVNANQAIALTAGQVRFKTGTTTIARTEFSASTGGWTAGGAFPAVQDLGDAYSGGNPYHPWTASYTVAEVAGKLGLNGVRSIVVTGRNGLGEWGGRVTSVVVVDGSGASHTYSGTKFRSTMGTTTFRSDWFVVAWTSPAEAEAVVKALYQDLLGRAPDPTGLQGWSSALMQGISQSALVASLTRSDEYIWSRVTKAYREVLGREPDPVGATSWLNAIKAGQATVDDVQRRFYDSTEYYLASGGTTEGYVKRLYTTMLRRPASAAEVSTWVSVFNQKGRAWVVDAIWFSLEAASVRAGDYYGTFLGRAPDPAGQAAWAQVLLQHGEGAVRVGIAGSLEYRARAIARFP